MALFKFTVKTEEKDRGAKRLSKAWRRLDGSKITVGVHEGAGDYPTGVGVADVATWNEFGTRNIPERSFIRSTMDIKRRNFLKFEEKLFDQMISGLINEKQVINKMGFRIKSAIETRIKTASQWAEPNALSTATQKNRSGGAIRGASPLIETGLLSRSITSKSKLGSL